MMAEEKQPDTAAIPHASVAQEPRRAPFAAPQQRRRERAASDYKKSLKEKQTLKHLYGLSERQFKRYVLETLERMGKVENVSDELVRRLEKRLDNVVFRTGIAKSRPHARQLVSHAYFLINGKPVNIPSFQVQKGDKLELKATKRKKKMMEELTEGLKKHQAPSWMKVGQETVAAEITGEPTMADANPPAEIPLIFEFYSR